MTDIPSNVQSIRQRKPRSLPSKTSNKLRLPIVGVITKQDPAKVRHRSLSNLFATRGFPETNLMFSLRDNPRPPPIQLARATADRPDFDRLFAWITGLRRWTNVSVRPMLTSMSKLRIGMVTHRDKPMRHFPSAVEILDRGFDIPIRARVPKPAIMRTVLRIHATSRLRDTKGARSAWIRSTRNRYLHEQ
jgi:hypothetical protein